jgi:flagellar hook-associated protein 2
MATNSTSSATAYSYLSSSSNRFSGLASGMDIDSIVEKLMKAESAKMEKLQQQKQKYEWQRDAYRSVNTKLETFRTNAFDNFGKVSDFAINKLTNSNESKLGVTPTASASGTLNIEQATLAKSVPGVAKNTTVANLSNTSTMADLGIAAGTATLQVAQQDGTYRELIISYTESDTLDSIAQKINAQSKGATAIVGDDGTFSISSKATGNFTGGSVKVDGTSPLFTALGFTSNELANGTDGSYTVNGVTKSIKTNSFSISGYNVELKGEIQAGSPVTVSSSLDTTAVVDKVKSFIDSYNTLIKDLKGQTSEKKAMDYQPLTDAQRAEMSDDEITKWEAKAKQGILRNDNAIAGSLNSMRSALSSLSIDIGDGKKMSIFSLGIDTNKDGTLTIKDESKLTKAIENNLTDVANLFTGTASSPTGEGIVSKLRSAAKSAIDTITLKAGKEGQVENTYTLGKNIIDMDKRIDDWKDRLKDIEDRYFKQFTAMETAIQNANTQSSIFAQ